LTNVIVDTSSILFGISNKKDVFESAERSYPGANIIISKGVIRELTSISQNMGRKGSNARVGLTAINIKNLKVDNSNANVDSWILSIAPKEPDNIVITNDTRLRGALLRKKITALKLSRDGSLR
jgi:rRNA-processing protein FCF1